MKTKEQIEAQLATLREELEADNFKDGDFDRDWSDVSNMITALEWVLGSGEGGKAETL